MVCKGLECQSDSEERLSLLGVLREFPVYQTSEYHTQSCSEVRHRNSELSYMGRVLGV